MLEIIWKFVICMLVGLIIAAIFGLIEAAIVRLMDGD